MNYKTSLHIREILRDVYMYKYEYSNKYSKFKINTSIMFSGVTNNFNTFDICQYIIIKNENN